jgi:hypothetical protein
VNTGSTGRPKDGDPRAGYALVTMDGTQVDVEMIRVDYDIDHAAEGIKASDLPDDFAEILRTGGKVPAQAYMEAWMRIDIYDPAMGCSTGVCGSDVDPQRAFDEFSRHADDAASGSRAHAHPDRDTAGDHARARGRGSPVRPAPRWH